MASTSSNARTHNAAGSGQADVRGDALRALVWRGARIQIAACSAAARTLADWARSADRFAQAAGDELLRHIDGQIDTAELVARTTNAGGVHLRELRALPRAAANHFDTRLARVSID